MRRAACRLRHIASIAAECSRTSPALPPPTTNIPHGTPAPQLSFRGWRHGTSDNTGAYESYHLRSRPLIPEHAARCFSTQPQGQSQQQRKPEPPIASRRPEQRTAYGLTWTDDYRRGSAARSLVLVHLAHENKFVHAPLSLLRCGLMLLCAAAQ